MSLNIHVYPSPLNNESRILRITKSISNNSVFKKILIVGVLIEGVSENECLDDRRQILRLPQKFGGNRTGLVVKIVKSIEWNWRLIFALSKKRPDCINCHSLSVLPACVMLKFFCRSKLVYDTHELETESATSHGIRKVLSKIIERSLIGFTDVVIVVSESISDWYRSTYRLASVPVIRNVPDCSRMFPQGRDDYLGKKFGINEEAFVFIYMGILAPGRGIDILLDAFSQTRTNSHIIFMGFGVLAGKVKEYEKKFSNIHFHSAVPPEDIARHLSGADVGISLIENVCLSYYYCLPNKLFEYISNGIPVVVSDFPDMKKIINENDCGWSMRVDVEEMKIYLGTLTRDDIEQKRKNAVGCRLKYDWSIEEKKLLGIYANLFPS